MARRGVGHSLALLVAGIGFSLLLAEGLLRLAGFEFDLAPDRIEFGWPTPTVIDPRYAPDPDLFWVTADHAEKLERLRREHPTLLFLGDSCTEYSSYPALVMERLSARLPGDHLRGEKLAVAGWSSYQGRRLLERDVLPLRPRIVTLYYGWNDHWDAFGTEDARVAELGLPAPLQGLRLAQLAHRVRVARYRSQLEQRIEAGIGSRVKRVAPDDFEANLTAMVQTAARQQVIAMLLTAPTSHRLGAEPKYLEKRWLHDLSELVPIHQRYVASVRRVARRTAAPLCDLEARFAALDPARLAGAFHEDGIHLTPTGDVILADALSECLTSSPELLRALADRPPEAPAPSIAKNAALPR
jgi:lysophospholipase L1-like esterase